MTRFLLQRGCGSRVSRWQSKPKMTVADRRENICSNRSVKSCSYLSPFWVTFCTLWNCIHSCHGKHSIHKQFSWADNWFIMSSLLKGGLVFHCNSLFFDCPSLSIHIHHFCIFLLITYLTSSNYWYWDQQIHPPMARGFQMTHLPPKWLVTKILLYTLLSFPLLPKKERGTHHLTLRAKSSPVEDHWPKKRCWD